MSGLLRFVRTTIVGGVLFLVPLVVLGAIIGKALQIAHRVSDPLTARLFPEAPPPLLLAAAVIVLVLFCFLAGLLAVTAPARRVVGWLESALLSKIPGYTSPQEHGRERARRGERPAISGRAGADRGFLAVRLRGRENGGWEPGCLRPGLAQSALGRRVFHGCRPHTRDADPDARRR